MMRESEHRSEQGIISLFTIVVLTCALGSLTQTAMNSMMAGVQATFGTAESVSQWLTTIYMLTIGIMVPLVTHLSRRVPMRTLILASLILFFAGSLIDALATTFPLLLFGRIPQAMATGITLPLLSTIAMTRFPPGKNGTAMGIAGIAMGFAPNIGPLIGGALVGSWGWRSFFVLLMAVLSGLILATFAFVRAEARPAKGARLDMLSFILSTCGFGGLLLGFTNAANGGLADPSVIVSLCLGTVALVWFIMRQRRLDTPLISMDIFESCAYRTSFAAQNFLFASFMGITLVIPLFVQNVCGMSALDAGLVFIPATIFAILVNPLAGWLSDRMGTRPVVVCASVLLVAGSAAMVFVDEACPLWLITLMQTVRGLGVSALIGPLNSWGMHELPHQLMMDASAFFTTVRQACASFGTALMMLSITFCGMGAALGYQIAFGFSAVCSCIVLVLSFIRVKR